MSELPSGTITLLFTDIERSTELVKSLREEYGRVLAEHRAVLRAAFAEHSGTEVDTQGDAFFVVFGRARDAAECAVAAQRQLAAHPWASGAPVSVRMGLHTGEVRQAERRYVGLAVHRAARLCTLAHGGQVVLSRSTAGIIDDEEIPGISLRDLGDHRLKDFDRPERVFQLVIEGLPSQFPPLRASAQHALLSGTATTVMVEGHRMLRLHRELTPEAFGALLQEYRRLVSDVFEASAGTNIETHADTILAGFSSAKKAAWAAARVMQAINTHDWSPAPKVEVSIGIHSAEAGIGWAGPAAVRCNELCDAAGGGQILVSVATAGLLEDEDLGELSLLDLGQQATRNGKAAVRAFELLAGRDRQRDED